jgi:hypothetical protein
VLVLALAGALLWRVWLHHRQAEPLLDEPAIVFLESAAPVLT